MNVLRMGKEMIGSGRRRSVSLVALGTAMVGCASSPESASVSAVHPTVIERLEAPWLVTYSQPPGPWLMYTKNVLPEDFVRNYSGYLFGSQRPLVAWTGIIVEHQDIDVEGRSIERFIVEHRYWDWKTTTDDHLIYVSDRGEGYFRCGFSEGDMGPGHAEGQFVIVYGIPISLDQGTNVVNMECMNTKLLRPKYFTTEAWSYGRKYAVHGDPNDIRILKADSP